MKSRRTRQLETPPSVAIDLVANALCVMLLVHVLKLPAAIAAQTAIDLSDERIHEAEQIKLKSQSIIDEVRRSVEAQIVGPQRLAGKVHLLVDVSGSMKRNQLLVASAAIQAMLVLNEAQIQQVKVTTFDTRYSELLPWTALDRNFGTAPETPVAAPNRTSTDAAAQLDSGNRPQIVKHIWEYFERLASGQLNADEAGGGRTDLVGAITKALIAARDSTEPVTIVLISDGLHVAGPGSEMAQTRQLLHDAFKSANIDAQELPGIAKVHAFGLIANELLDSKAHQGIAIDVIEFLAELASNSGGVAVAVPLPRIESAGTLASFKQAPSVEEHSDAPDAGERRNGKSNVYWGPR